MTRAAVQWANTMHDTPILHLHDTRATVDARFFGNLLDLDVLRADARAENDEAKLAIVEELRANAVSSLVASARFEGPTP